MEEIEWILCPVCKSKTRLKIRKDTVLKNFPLFCPKCKQETIITIRELNMSVIKEPDAKDAEPMNRENTVYRLFFIQRNDIGISF